MWYTYAIKYFSVLKKKKTPAICNSMDKSWGHYALRKSGKENTVWAHLHVESYKAQIIETVLISGFQETLKERKEMLVKGYTLPVIEEYVLGI